ncbi:DeoR/GlpR family DNA-binding transcription regulator [Chitinophaga pendula]|uniref:DeoR/GlpR family DNA-binding transcription regulator n=1 Tax=Chitinophaga TaxID=79328 RepID=UPI000BB09CAD|nr:MULTISPECIES: DeoR/GlpR family DNA-binding transcription regulator [Chitinophaga]ASZ10543.1 DeoR family transcriptional regulator [Chitinophaga sp. MD30]UCJ06484.1 DeoR/GlpR family DNA-binding transcription regulator [Chitinophaga pendula]
MLKEERLDYILRKLKEDQKVLHAELSDALQVSEDTVRRDLDVLAQNGLLIKVRGGAIPHSPNPFSFKERIQLHEDDKKTIAAKALSFLHDGQTIILDGGTSTYTLVKLFPPHLKLTVVTNNVPIAMQLIDHPSTEVILTGGRIFKNSQVTAGMDSIRMLQKVRADICFLGICSLHTEVGVTGPDMEEAEVKSTMVQAANRVIALSTTDKVGTAEPYRVCDITALDTIITDRPQEAILQPYINMGIKVI